jgi:hypothetical protein
MLGHVTGQLLDEVSRILAEVLDWPEDTRVEEVRRVSEILHNRHGVELEKLLLVESSS